MTLERQLYTVVRGKDSIIELTLKEAGSLVDSTEITRCDLVFRRTGVADITFTSADHPTWFDLQNNEIVEGLNLELVEINLRQIPSPPTDGYYEVDVHLYDAEYTNGRLWGTIDVLIRPAPPAGT